MTWRVMVEGVPHKLSNQLIDDLVAAEVCGCPEYLAPIHTMVGDWVDGGDMAEVCTALDLLGHVTYKMCKFSIEFMEASSQL